MIDRDSVLGRIKAYSHEFIFGFVFSVIIYSTFMTLQLTNTFDGLWRQNYDYKGDWELSLGRWFQPYIDKLHLGMHTDPLTSLISISFFVFGMIVILDLFNIHKRIISYTSMAIFLSSTLVSITLSYREFSIMYSLSFLLSTIAAHLMFDSVRRWLSVMISAILLCITMGIYQPYVAIFCVLVAFKVLVCDACSESTHSILRYIVDTLLSIVAGAILYLSLLFIKMHRHNVELSNYHSASSSLRFDTFLKLPHNIFRMYRLFIQYFVCSQDNLGYTVNVFQKHGLLLLFLLVSIAIIVMIAIKKIVNNGHRLVVYFIAALFIPIACNVELLLATDQDLQLHMTVAIALYPALVLIAFYKAFSEKKRFIGIVLALYTLIIFGNVLQIQLDQNAMYEGYNATYTMIADIIHDLNDKNLISKEYEYFFVGCPRNNEFFYVSPLYDRANNYGQVGRFWLSGNCMVQSYNGFINRRMGYNIYISNTNYEEYAEDDKVIKMPSYPENGYITQRDQEIIVKISN